MEGLDGVCDLDLNISEMGMGTRKDIQMAAGPSATPSVPTPAPSGGGKKWCVAKGGASAQALQANIDYACNNGVDCSAIQAGGACFLPNTVESHAAYVMNAYYQSHGRNDFNCDFSQTGLITTSNPSYSTCQFNA